MSNNRETKLRPTEDFAFKRIFGREDSKRSLMSLLNAILDGNPVIKDLTILNTETQIESRDNKASRLDIEVSTGNNTFINVELQCVDTGDLYSRSVFYSSSLIVQTSKKGKSYDETKVISIWIIRDKIKKGIISKRISPIEEIINCALPTKWGENYEPFTNKSRIIWVQLSKFKNNDKIKETISKGLKDWIEFFSNPNKITSNDEGMKDAQKLWDRISADEQLKAQKRAQEKYEMDKGSEIANAKEEGIAEGEYNAKIETAKNMLVDDVSIDIISKYTGLSINDIKSLL